MDALSAPSPTTPGDATHGDDVATTHRTPATPTTPATLGGTDTHSKGEAAVRKVLRAPSRSADEGQAHRLFSVSILLSAGRCLLTYLILPIFVPLIGTSVTTDAAVGLPLGVLAIIFDIRAVRRFWLADHRWRWPMTGLYAVVLAMVLGLVIHDLVVL